MPAKYWLAWKSVREAQTFCFTANLTIREEWKDTKPKLISWMLTTEVLDVLSQDDLSLGSLQIDGDWRMCLHFKLQFKAVNDSLILNCHWLISQKHSTVMIKQQFSKMKLPFEYTERYSHLWWKRNTNKSKKFPWNFPPKSSSEISVTKASGCTSSCLVILK